MEGGGTFSVVGDIEAGLAPIVLVGASAASPVVRAVVACKGGWQWHVRWQRRRINMAAGHVGGWEWVSMGRGERGARNIYTHTSSHCSPLSLSQPSATTCWHRVGVAVGLHVHVPGASMLCRTNHLFKLSACPRSHMGLS